MATDAIITPEVLNPALLGHIEEREKTDLRHHTITSKRLGGEREITVYVPAGYDTEPGVCYPVLYMQDGQNLFDPETSYVPGKPWFMDQTAEVLIREGRIPPVIIVAINHACEKRVDEYTLTKDAKRNGGKAAQYLQALLKDIKPFIDQTYRTMPGAHTTGIGGSSLGGLFSLYAGLECPETFGKVCAMSPSAWWDRRVIIKKVLEAEPKPRLSVWLDIGTKEGLDTLEDTRRLRDAFEERGWVEGTDLMYTEARNAIHDEAAWAARVAPMLEFLFRGQ